MGREPRERTLLVVDGQFVGFMDVEEWDPFDDKSRQQEGEQGADPDSQPVCRLS